MDAESAGLAGDAVDWVLDRVHRIPAAS